MAPILTPSYVFKLALKTLSETDSLTACLSNPRVCCCRLLRLRLLPRCRRSDMSTARTARRFSSLLVSSDARAQPLRRVLPARRKHRPACRLPGPWLRFTAEWCSGVWFSSNSGRKLSVFLGFQSLRYVATIDRVQHPTRVCVTLKIRDGIPNRSCRTLPACTRPQCVVNTTVHNSSCRGGAYYRNAQRTASNEPPKPRP